jgi:hypothetical protein
VLHHRSVDGGQPEPRSLSDRLRREEWLEDPRQIFGRDTHAAVSHGDVREPARRDVERDRRARRFIELLDVGRYGELATAWHGIARVDAEVQHRALQLHGVADDRHRLGRKLGDHGDPSIDAPLEERGRLPDDRRDVHRSAQYLTLARECEELVCQFRSALGCEHDEVAQFALLFSCGE